MIFKRFAANLRGQNWGAILIELGIVILGVFIGTLVANWNEERARDRDTRQLLLQIRPDLVRLVTNFKSTEPYYATTRRYADVALAGWRGDPRVSDREFIIAAYQASQVYALTIDSATWASVIGGDQIRSLRDPELRRKLLEVMYADYSPVKSTSLFTDYRKNVRRLIPLPIQERIRARCGDISLPNGDGSVLPATCDLEIAPEQAAEAAAKLRAKPELADDLDYHFTVIAIALNMARGARGMILDLLPDLDRYINDTGARRLGKALKP